MLLDIFPMLARVVLLAPVEGLLMRQEKGGEAKKRQACKGQVPQHEQAAEGRHETSCEEKGERARNRMGSRAYIFASDVS